MQEDFVPLLQVPPWPPCAHPTARLPLTPAASAQLAPASQPLTERCGVHAHTGQSCGRAHGVPPPPRAGSANGPSAVSVGGSGLSRQAVPSGTRRPRWRGGPPAWGFLGCGRMSPRACGCARSVCARQPREQRPGAQWRACCAQPRQPPRVPSCAPSPVQDVVNTHPGLAFLKEASEFHSRYITTVSARGRPPGVRAPPDPTASSRRSPPVSAGRDRCVRGRGARHLLSQQQHCEGTGPARASQTPALPRWAGPVTLPRCLLLEQLLGLEARLP